MVIFAVMLLIRCFYVATRRSCKIIYAISHQHGVTDERHRNHCATGLKRPDLLQRSGERAWYPTAETLAVTDPAADEELAQVSPVSSPRTERLHEKTCWAMKIEVVSTTPSREIFRSGWALPCRFRRRGPYMQALHLCECLSPLPPAGAVCGNALARASWTSSAPSPFK